MKTHVYVDGESHWIRSESCCKKLHGPDAELINIRSFAGPNATFSFPDSAKPEIRVIPEGKFFWATTYGLLVRDPIRFLSERVSGVVYYTDFSGNDPDLHQVKLAIRQQGFDPQVIKERSELAKHRKNRLATDGVLEKPKGVDIGLTVRLLEDAYRNIFDLCYLFTSDVDYIPVIRAMQQIGRKVVVFGYTDGLGQNSELEFVPDQFIDLSTHLKNCTIEKPAKVKAAEK